MNDEQKWNDISNDISKVCSLEIKKVYEIVSNTNFENLDQDMLVDKKHFNENLEFMFGSLYYRRLYIASYDITNYKFQSLTSYNLGNRVRDILKIDDKTYIGLLEDPPRISIITTNNN